MGLARHEADSSTLTDGFELVYIHALDSALRERINEEFFTTLIRGEFE